MRIRQIEDTVTPEQMSTQKKLLKAYVDGQRFHSTTQIMDAMKEMFRDVLQLVIESELDTELG